MTGEIQSPLQLDWVPMVSMGCEYCDHILDPFTVIRIKAVQHREEPGFVSMDDWCRYWWMY